MIQEQELANLHVIPSISVVNEPLDYQVVQSQVVPQEIVSTNELDDPRLHVFRKLSKSLKPAVLLKSWQRVCMLVAGIETSQLYGQTNIATLEKEIYDRYHGNLNRDPPIIGTVKRAMEDQLEALNIERFGIRFPKDKISYVQMTAGMPGHTIWRYYKELVTEVTNRINMGYRSVLNDDLTYPEGKQLFDVIDDTLRALWYQNEDVRKERITKRVDDGSGNHDDSDSEHDLHGHDGSAGLAIEDDRFSSARKRHANLALLNTKPFPGVGKYQPIGFLAFLLMGPPAGEKCWTRFALDAHYEAAPPRPRLSVSSRHRLSLGTGSVSLTEEDKLDDYISPRHDRKRPRSSKDGTESNHNNPGNNNGNTGSSHQHHHHLTGGGRGSVFEEENEAIRIFNAETAARAQRLEELKMALSLFPSDENIKGEFKQFLDTQRRTTLSAEALAAAAAAAASAVEPHPHAAHPAHPHIVSQGALVGVGGLSQGMVQQVVVQQQQQQQQAQVPVNVQQVHPAHLVHHEMMGGHQA